MDLRLVSLLLLLAYACGAWSRTTRNYPRIIPRRQQQRFSIQRRSAHLLQRPVRAISEFLEPPPLPIANHVQFPPSPSNYRLRKPHSSSHNQAQGSSASSPAVATSSLPLPRGKQSNTRNGRYARPQSADSGYLSNLIGWLNPFAPANVDAASKDAHAQGTSHLPQYAPHMPYTSGSAPRYTQHSNGPPPHSPQTAPPTEPFARTASTWTSSSSSCNPCDVLPWTPVIRNDIAPYPSQYAANYGSNSYVDGPPTGSQPLDTPGYSYPVPSSHSAVLESTPPPSPGQRDDYPHLSSGATPPLYQAQPFRDTPQDYHTAPGSDQLPPPVFHQASSSSLDHHPHRQQEQQQQFQSQVQYNHQAPATSNQHYHIHIQQSPIIDIEQAPFIEEDHLPASHGLDYHQAAATDVEPIQPQHQSSQHVQVTKDAPFDLTVGINNQQDADPAESRPVFRVTGQAADSNERSRASGTSVHFQRSPLIELSVAGESSPTSGNRLPPAKPKTKVEVNAESSTVPPSATLIDYIVSSPRETDSREETRPAASTTTATSTTTMTTSRSTSTDASVAAVAVDQKQQESRIETLVQSYEFYKNNKSNRPKLNETMTAATVNSGGGVYSSENDDFSASREALAPSNSSDSAKKIIQIIIPYTSQYTPSPFHPTKSVSQKRGDEQRPEQTTPRYVQQPQQQDVGDNSIEDSEPITHKSRRIPAVTVTPGPEPALRNHNHTGNSIDVHRLQKNIDNWTIQEFSKKASAIRNLINATYPRWISSKQIPDEYLLTNTAEEDSNEYYDFSHETQQHRGINRNQMTSTTTTTTSTTTTTTTSTEPTSRVKVVNAIYPKSTKKPGYLPKTPSAGSNNGDKEKVYVVTPVPNSLEDSSMVAKDQEGSISKARKGKVKKQNSDGLEQAYQVLPQAVNNLAVLANAPESAAPALWGIMEHEQIATNPNQPRWRSESDILPEPASTPVLYAGHSKVTYFRTKVH